MIIDLPVEFTQFLDTWQTLVGSALGPFFAIFLAVIAYVAKEKWLAYRARKEGLRIVEISTVGTFNDLYDIKYRLLDFVARIRKIANDGKPENDPGFSTSYYIEETNFPPCREISFKKDLVSIRFRSPYLHNQLLFMEAGVKEINNSLKELKENFSAINRKNELIISFKASPMNQREAYIPNLEGFAKAIEDFVKYMDKAIMGITQTNIYNAKIRKQDYLTRWKYENIDFKYFRNKKEIHEYQMYPTFYDRINLQLEAEVNEKIQKATTKRESL